MNLPFLNLDLSPQTVLTVLLGFAAMYLGARFRRDRRQSRELTKEFLEKERKP